MLDPPVVMYSHTWSLAPTTAPIAKEIRDMLSISIDAQLVESPCDDREILLLCGSKSGAGGPFCRKGCRVLSFNLDTLREGRHFNLVGGADSK